MCVFTLDTDAVQLRTVTAPAAGALRTKYAGLLFLLESRVGASLVLRLRVDSTGRRTDSVNQGSELAQGMILEPPRLYDNF